MLHLESCSEYVDPDIRSQAYTEGKLGAQRLTVFCPIHSENGCSSSLMLVEYVCSEFILCGQQPLWPVPSAENAQSAGRGNAFVTHVLLSFPSVSQMNPPANLRP